MLTTWREYIRRDPTDVETLNFYFCREAMDLASRTIEASVRHRTAIDFLPYEAVWAPTRRPHFPRVVFKE